MSFDSEAIFPYRLVVASGLAALGFGLLGVVGVALKIMQDPAWEVALQAGVISGLLAAILGVAAGGQAAWRYLRHGGHSSEKQTETEQRVPYALITSTVAVAGGSGLVAGSGVVLKVLKLPYWELPMQVGSLGGLLAVFLGISAGGQALWRSARHGGTETGDAG